MENNPEIPEVHLSLQQLFKGVLDEDYSAFFVCHDEYTAGVMEQAASDSEVGRGELLDLVAREAFDRSEGQHIQAFLFGGLAFIKGSQLDMLDVNMNHISSNITHWYIRLTRQDIAYLYTNRSNEFIEKAYPISVRTSMKNR